MSFTVFATAIISAMLINNVILMQFLGICPFLGVSKRSSSAIGMSAAVLFVMVIASAVTYTIYDLVLAPFNIDYIGTIAFILVIASLVQLVEMIVEKFSPSLYGALGIFLPLIAVNCAILGGSLFMQIKDFSGITESAIYGFGSGVGWLLAIVAIAAIREKIAYSNVPAPLKGLGITFIITGLMAIGFMSFMGIKL